MSTVSRSARVYLATLSLDAWLFLIVVGGYAVAFAFRYADGSARIPVLLLAAAAIVTYTLSGSYRTRLLLVIMAVAAIAVAPVVLGIYLRHITAPYQFVHDGLIQTEEAVKFLLAGKNPYAEDYLGTPLEYWWPAEVYGSLNPAVFHLVYMPFLLLVSLPWYLLVNSTIGWFDERVVYLALFLLLLVLFPKLTKTRAKAFGMILVVGLNPLFVPFFAEGRNDVFVLFWLVLAAVLLQSRLLLWAMVALGFACATKLTAWFSVPFFLLYAFAVRADRMRTLRDYVGLVKRALPYVAVLVLISSAIIVPFLLWNPAAFVNSVFLYPVGQSDHGYPISSVGFGGLALALGWIPSNTSPFPFEQLELALGLPTLGALVWLQSKHNTLSRMWLGCGLLTLVMGFFSHVFNDNHLGFALSLIALGLFSDAPALPPIEQPGVEQQLGQQVS